MKHIVITLAAAVLLLIAAVAQAGIQDFTLINHTGYDIYYVYVSATTSDSWEEDLLGNEILYNGERLQINFTGGSNHCYWDLKVQDEDGDAFDWRNIDLCTYYEVELVLENGRFQAYYH